MYLENVLAYVNLVAPVMIGSVSVTWALLVATST